MKDIIENLLHLKSINKAIICDEELLQKKIKILKSYGVKKLKFVVDFDRTISKFRLSPIQLNPTSFGVFESDSNMDEDVKKTLLAYRDHYRPIEIDPTISEEDKLPLMIEWWVKSQQELLSCHMTKESLIKTVLNSKLQLRDGSDKLILRTNELDIPFLVFSAGQGDVIDQVLKKEKLFFENVRVIANTINFDSKGKIESFSKPLIHIFNKTLKSVLEVDKVYWETVLEPRGATILLGDSTGDVKMAKDEDNAVVLRIGYLNDGDRAKLEKVYDILLVDDETFDVANSILAYISEN